MIDLLRENDCDLWKISRERYQDKFPVKMKSVKAMFELENYFVKNDCGRSPVTRDEFPVKMEPGKASFECEKDRIIS